MRYGLYFLVWCLLGTTVVRAQPPAPDPVPVPNVISPDEVLAYLAPTPESAISRFLRQFNEGNWGALIDLVEGAKQDPVLEQAGRELVKARGTLEFNLLNVGSDIKGDNATVTVVIRASDHLGAGMVWNEAVSLHRQAVTWKNPQGWDEQSSIWRIVPGEPRVLYGTAADGYIKRTAAYIAYPAQMMSLARVRESAIQAKMIGLSLMQFLQANNEKFAFTSETFREKIRPYLRSEDLFTAPGDADGTQSYSFNPKLVNADLARLSDISKTVMLYLGHDYKLDFRYDGLTIVAFVDGHVEYLNAEQAKKLRWDP